MPNGPVVVADQLPDSSPLKALGVKFVKDYEAQFGGGTAEAMAAYSYDAGILLQHAIPVALQTAETRHTRVPLGSARGAGRSQSRACYSWSFQYDVDGPQWLGQACCRYDYGS